MMCDFNRCPFQQRIDLRLSRLHCAGGGYHVEVLMGCSSGGMLGWLLYLDIQVSVANGILNGKSCNR